MHFDSAQRRLDFCDPAMVALIGSVREMAKMTHHGEQMTGEQMIMKIMPCERVRW
jgi:hypothetical protein